MEKIRINSGFLNVDSNAGTIIRSLEWANHPLGTIENWPAGLRITLNIVLNSNSPKLLLWGPENVCFYNDAFISILEKTGKHPRAMGQVASQIWVDEWDFVLYQFNKVKRFGKSLWTNDRSMPIFYHDESDRLIYRYNLSPAIDKENNIQGVLVTGERTSSLSPEEKNKRRKHIKPSNIVEYFNEGTLSVNHHWIITDLNNLAEQYLNLKRKDVIGKMLWEINPDTLRNEFTEILQKAMNEREMTSFRTYSEMSNSWFDILLSPVPEGLNIHFFDVTEQHRFKMINKRTEEISGVAGWEFDVSTKSIFVTPKTYEIYGLPEGTIIDLEINKKLFDKESLKKIEKALDHAINNQEPYELEMKLKKSVGAKKIIRINGFPLVDNGKTLKLYGTIKDITRQKKKQQERDEIIKRLTTAQKIAKLGYWKHNIIENKSEWTREVYDIWEADPETFKPDFESFIASIHPDDRGVFLRNMDDMFPGQDFYDNEHRIITPSGQIKWILERVTLHRDKKGVPVWLEGIAQDITEKKVQEKKILNALKEKEVLLAEIHHRVKNNLAVVSGMLQLQAFEEKNSAVKEKLIDSVGRIISMASIHEQLYRSNSFSKLDFSGSLENLIQKIFNTMQVETDINLDFHLDPMLLNVNQAVPFSLIVNEVVTNVIKHAFKGKRSGKVIFTLTEKENQVCLTVRDNGVGIPENFIINKSSTLGLRLIDILAKQLDALYTFNKTDEGTDFTIQFEKLEMKGTDSAHM